MIFNKQMFTVFKRELNTLVMRRSFVVSTILMPVIMIVVSTVQATFFNTKNDKETEIVIAYNQVDIRQEFEQLVSEEEFAQSGQYAISYENIPDGDIDKYIENLNSSLVSNSNMGIFWIPDDSLNNKISYFYSSNPSNNDVKNKISAVINASLNRLYFDGKNVNLADIEYAQADTEIKGIKVSRGGTEEESMGGFIIVFSLSLFLLFSLFTNAAPVFGTVIDEKNNRIYEVLLSSVRPIDLITGKILGVGVSSLIQMLIWVMFLVIITQLLSNFSPLPDNLKMEVDLGLAVYFLINFFIGSMTFLCICGGLGSIFDNTNDANAVWWPIFFLILIPFYGIFTLLGNPANSLSEILSMAPFMSLYVMPARLALIEVPTWQVFAAMASNIWILLSLFKPMAKIYHTGILKTGTKPSFREVVTWLR